MRDYQILENRRNCEIIKFFQNTLLYKSLIIVLFDESLILPFVNFSVFTEHLHKTGIIFSARRG